MNILIKHMSGTSPASQHLCSPLTSNNSPAMQHQPHPSTMEVLQIFVRLWRTQISAALFALVQLMYGQSQMVVEISQERQRTLPTVSSSCYGPCPEGVSSFSRLFFLSPLPTIPLILKEPLWDVRMTTS